MLRSAQRRRQSRGKTQGAKASMTCNGCPRWRKSEWRAQDGAGPRACCDPAVFTPCHCRSMWARSRLCGAMRQACNGPRLTARWLNSNSASGRVPSPLIARQGPLTACADTLLRAQTAGLSPTCRITSRTCPAWHPSARRSCGQSLRRPWCTTSTRTSPWRRRRAVSEPSAESHALRVGETGRRGGWGAMARSGAAGRSDERVSMPSGS